jgi:epoxyqueuosine reductase
MSSDADKTAINFRQLARHIHEWTLELGFQQCGITDTRLTEAEQHLQAWLQQGYHGDMDYMARHGNKRTQPDQLVPGTMRIISVRMNYWPDPCTDAESILSDPDKAYLSRYALGRDYHKVLRKRLQRLAERITDAVGTFGYRVFVDSAPVMEKALAEKAGLGWIGKHTNLINEKKGSWFFLGEIYTDLPLPVDEAATNHCGTCHACMDACPTDAIVAPYQLDARRCISYLTIEHHGSIPVELRPFVGNRIYGCDDCQLVCPWNRFTDETAESDFLPRHELDNSSLLELFSWNETTFLNQTEGSAIRRIGYQRWLRNIAVALGNASASNAVIDALERRLSGSSPMLQEHIQWALKRQRNRI